MIKKYYSIENPPEKNCKINDCTVQEKFENCLWRYCGKGKICDADLFFK